MPSAGPALSEMKLALAGAGRAGAAFARSWRGAGGAILQVIVRDPARPLPEALSGVRAVTVADAGPAVDVLVLAVPDDAIAPVAAALAPVLTTRCAFHLSGAVASAALGPFSARGTAVASIHPVRPFTGAAGEDWRGAFVAVEGDAEGAATGSRIAAAMGARPHAIPPEAKPLYHAAATLAAGGTAAVVSLAVRGWTASGIPEDVAREALAGLAELAARAVGRQPFADAFTGALARRDVGTVRAHARALESLPEGLEVYRALAREILRRTPGRGHEPEIETILARADSDR